MSLPTFEYYHYYLATAMVRRLGTCSCFDECRARRVWGIRKRGNSARNKKAKKLCLEHKYLHGVEVKNYFPATKCHQGNIARWLAMQKNVTLLLALGRRECEAFRQGRRYGV